MSRNNITKLLREEVATRANHQCEYCLLRESFSFFSFHIEHIRSLKHGGTNSIDNLAYSCPDCNFAKGSDIATYSAQEENLLVRFYNPRIDNWEDNFHIRSGRIDGSSEIGIATVRIFKFNEVERIIFRQQLIEAGFYP